MNYEHSEKECTTEGPNLTNAVLPSARAPRRVVVLGTGAMGRRHVRVLGEMPSRYVLSGVFDVESGVAEDVARPWGVPVFHDMDEGIEAAEIVVIASPIHAHAASAMRALEQGRHVLVEKPMCASVSEASLLLRAAERSGAHLFVGHSERFNPVIVALKEIVRAREVRAIALQRAAPIRIQAGARFREEGVLLSLGVHDVDLVSHLTESRVELRGVSGGSNNTNEDRAVLTLVAATGAVAHVVADRLALQRKRTISIETRDELFEGDLLVPGLVRRRRGTRGPGIRVELRAAEPLVAQARAVAAALDGGLPNGVATGWDGTRALSIALEARQRLRAESASHHVSEAS
jgi:predicted dehydrogenase